MRELLYTVTQLNNILKNKDIPYSSNGLDKRANKLYKQIINTNKKKAGNILNNIKNNLKNIEIKSLPVSEITEDINQLKNDLNKYKDIVIPNTYKQIDNYCNDYKNEIIEYIKQSFNIKKINYNKKSEYIINNINKWTEYFLKQYYIRLNNYIDEYFQSAGIYEKSIGLVKSNKILKTVYGIDSIIDNISGDNYFDLMSDTNMGDTRSITTAGVWNSVGITRLIIVATVDKKTTQICLRLNGTIIETQDAVDLYADAFDKPDPEGYLDRNSWMRQRGKGNKNVFISNKGKEVPIKRGMPSNTLTKNGVGLPPYHGKCRTVTEIDATDRPAIIGSKFESKIKRPVIRDKAIPNNYKTFNNKNDYNKYINNKENNFIKWRNDLNSNQVAALKRYNKDYKEINNYMRYNKIPKGYNTKQITQLEKDIKNIRSSINKKIPENMIAYKTFNNLEIQKLYNMNRLNNLIGINALEIGFVTAYTSMIDINNAEKDTDDLIRAIIKLPKNTQIALLDDIESQDKAVFTEVEQSAILMRDNTIYQIKDIIEQKINNKKVISIIMEYIDE